MYVEELRYIPEMISKYMESLPIYSKYVRNQPQTKYVGEPHDPWNAALADNDNSNVLQRRNTSLAYHTVSKIFINKVYFIWMPLGLNSNQKNENVANMIMQILSIRWTLLKKREGVFSIPKCINPTKLNSKNTSKENKHEWNAIFQFSTKNI